MFQHHRNWSARLAAISPSLLLLLALATQAAHALVTGPVTHVTIHGNRRVPEKRIRGELRNAPGRAYSHIVAGQDIERVMHLAEFSDVCITARTDAGGVAIDVVVAELPTITDVSVETSGVDAPDSRAQGIAIGRVFAPQAWQDYLRRLADALVAEDYHDAQITSLER